MYQHKRFKNGPYKFIVLAICAESMLYFISFEQYVICPLDLTYLLRNTTAPIKVVFSGMNW